MKISLQAEVEIEEIVSAIDSVTEISHLEWLLEATAGRISELKSLWGDTDKEPTNAELEYFQHWCKLYPKVVQRIIKESE